MGMMQFPYQYAAFFRYFNWFPVNIFFFAVVRESVPGVADLFSVLSDRPTRNNYAVSCPFCSNPANVPFRFLHDFSSIKSLSVRNAI